MPTPPWMQGPLLLPPDEVLDLSKKVKKSRSDGSDDHNRSLTQGVRGGRGRQAMKKIVESITRLQRVEGVREKEESGREVSEFRVSLGGEEGEWVTRSDGGRVPWARTERIVFRREKKVRVATAAERSLPEAELMRLRSEARKIRRWVKVKKAGVTEEKVEEIRMAWRESELAMIKFDLPLCRNMERALEIIETKTEGFVVWSKRDTLVVYRGHNYQSPSKVLHKSHSGLAGGERAIIGNSEDDVTLSQYGTISTKEGKEDFLPAGLVVGKNEGIESVNGTLYEREANRLLDGLGPRFIDWWWPKPLPVDADLLPEVVPNFRPPLRICPPRIGPKLSDDELTYLRKLARPLPTHFALETQNFKAWLRPS